MFDAPERLLWASREARVLAYLPPLPRLEILGGFFGAPQRTDPHDIDFPDIEDLALAWPRATASAAGIAEIASQSAMRCLLHRDLQADDPTKDTALRLGALGWAIAHTGSARALIFTPGKVPAGAAAKLIDAGFSRITRFQIGGAP